MEKKKTKTDQKKKKKKEGMRSARWTRVRSLPRCLPIHELLARPRLPRSPYEDFRKSAVNGRTMKPLNASVTATSGISGEDARRSEELESEKARVRALGGEMGKLKLPPK